MLLKSPDDCAQYADIIANHERRLNDFDVWKERTSGQVNAILKALEDSKNAQDRTCEVLAQTGTLLSSKLESVANIQHSMQLESATERGRSEQKAKSLYLFITLMGLLPMIATIFAAIKLTPH